MPKLFPLCSLFFSQLSFSYHHYLLEFGFQAMTGSPTPILTQPIPSNPTIQPCLSLPLLDFSTFPSPSVVLFVPQTYKRLKAWLRAPPNTDPIGFFESKMWRLLLFICFFKRDSLMGRSERTLTQSARGLIGAKGLSLGPTIGVVFIDTWVALPLLLLLLLHPIKSS